MEAVRAVAVPTPDVFDTVYRKLCLSDTQRVSALPPRHTRYWDTITIDAGPETGEILDRFDEILHHYPYISSHVSALRLKDVEPTENDAPNDDDAFVISRNPIFPFIAWSFDSIETLDMTGFDFTLIKNAPNLFQGLGRNRLHTLTLRRCRFTQSLLLHLLSAVGYHLKQLTMSNNFLAPSKNGVSTPPSQLGAIGPRQFFFDIRSSSDEDILHVLGTHDLIASYFKVFCITNIVVTMATLNSKALHNLGRFMIWTGAIETLSTLTIRAESFGLLEISEVDNLALIIPTWARALWLPLAAGDPSPGWVDWYILSMPGGNECNLDTFLLELTLDFAFAEDGQSFITTHAAKDVWRRLDRHLCSITSLKRITLVGNLRARDPETEDITQRTYEQDELAVKAEAERAIKEYFQRALPGTYGRPISETTVTLCVGSPKSRKPLHVSGRDVFT